MKTFYTNNKNKSNMKNKFFLLILGIYSSSIFAQHDPQFTQYMYNTININPAYAGTSGVMSVFGMYRTQWVGLDGAPNNIALSLNTPISDTNMGLGISVVNDKIGPTSQSNISADFSYALPINDVYRFAIGLKATANLFDVDYTKLNSFSSNDPLHYNVVNEFTPNIGAGAYLYSEKLYLGFSVPNILENTYYNDNEPIAKRVSKDRMHFYFIGGYVFDLSSDIKFKPAFLSKIVNGAPLQFDFSANFMFNEKFVLGAAYRWSAAISALAGFQISDNMFIGYSYDTETTKLNNYNNGSHEIFLKYEFRKKSKNIVSPRFF
jgi:type IX secretion system PorP/SprF family membrane protein